MQEDTNEATTSVSSAATTPSEPAETSHLCETTTTNEGSTTLTLGVKQTPGKCGHKGKVLQIATNITKGCVNVELGEIKSRALVDTGASLCFINKRLFDKLAKGDKCTHVRRSNMSVLLADGNAIRVEQSALISFKIKGVDLRERFHVLPELNRPMVLGVNFLRKYRGRVSFLGEEPTAMNSICTLVSEYIPANSEHTFNAVVVNHNGLEGQVGITEGLETNTGYLIKHALVSPKTSNNIIPITIANPTNTGFVLEKHVPVGYFSPFDMSQAIPLGTLKGRGNEINSMDDEEDFIPINSGENPLDCLPKPDDPLKYKVCQDLSEVQRDQVKAIIESNRKAFVINENAIGLNTENEVTLELKPDAKPSNRPSYRMSPHKEVFQRELLEKQLKQGVLEVCSEPSEYNSPAFLVAKPQGDKSQASGWRIVVDYRGVNQNLKSFSYSFPRTDDLMDTIGRTGARYFSKLDVYSAYHQIKLAKESRHLTTFSANGTRYRARVLPMGLKTSGLAFQNVMEQLLLKCKYRNAVAYVDDVAIYSPTWERHLEDLDEVLKLFIKGNIKLKSEKCEFGTTKMDFLGFRVNQHGLSPSPDKIWPIKTFPQPKNVGELRSFNGMAQFYKRFIRGFAHVMKPLYELLKGGKSFIWTAECQKSFESIKAAICTEATLQFPDFDKPFIIFTDASDTSCGAVLTQLDSNGFYRPIEFAGKSHTSQEARYSVTDREMLGVIFGIRRFHHYIDGTHFTLYSDHTALVSLFNKKENITNGRLARWIDTVMAYDFEVKYLQGRANIVADMLSRRDYPPQPEDSAPMRSQGKLILPPKKLQFSSILITKYFHAEDPIPVHPILLGAPRSILKGGRPWGSSSTKVKGIIARKGSMEREQLEDSMREQETLCVLTRSASQNVNTGSVVIQDTGAAPADPAPSSLTGHRVRKTRARPSKNSTPAGPLRVSVKTAESKRKRLCHKMEPIAAEAIRFLSTHSSLNPSSEDLKQEQKKDMFIEAVYSYLRNESLPPDNSLARQVMLCHDQFIIIQGILYRVTHSVLGRSADPTLQIAIPAQWAERLVEATHASPLGGHLGSTRTYDAIKARYYWRGMYKDVHDIVGTCHICLTTKKKPKNLKTPMVLREPVLTAYTHLTMDAIGPFTPANDGNKYIHVVVDHATRHITAWASVENTTACVALDFFNRVICQ